MSCPALWGLALLLTSANFLLERVFFRDRVDPMTFCHYNAQIVTFHSVYSVVFQFIQ